jgi:thioredoxin 2
MSTPDTVFKLRCPSCRARNRIPADKVGRAAKCGKCAASFSTAVLQEAAPVMVADGSFDRMVIHSPLPVILYCWAPWCSGCAQAGPIMDDFARKAKGRVRVAKLNVDASPQTAARFDVRSIPFLYIFDNGQLKESLPGGLPVPELMRKMTPYL